MSTPSQNPAPPPSPTEPDEHPADLERPIEQVPGVDVREGEPEEVDLSLKPRQ